MTLHVGDGLLFGYKQDPIYHKIKKLLSEHFESKARQDLVAKGVDDLGLTWRRVKDGIQADVREQLNKLVIL